MDASACMMNHAASRINATGMTEGVKGTPVLIVLYSFPLALGPLSLYSA